MSSYSGARVRRVNWIKHPTVLRRRGNFCWCNVNCCAPLHTDIFESWTARKAVSEVAESAGTKQTCYFSSSPSNLARVNVRPVNGRGSMTKSAVTEPPEKRTPVQGGNVTGKALDPCERSRAGKGGHDAAIDGSEAKNNPLQHHGSQESPPRDDVEGKNTSGPKFLGHVERGRTLTLGWESVLLMKGCADGREGTRIGPLQRRRLSGKASSYRTAAHGVPAGQPRRCRPQRL